MSTGLDDAAAPTVAAVPTTRCRRRLARVGWTGALLVVVGAVLGLTIALDDGVVSVGLGHLVAIALASAMLSLAMAVISLGAGSASVPPTEGAFGSVGALLAMLVLAAGAAVRLVADGRRRCPRHAVVAGRRDGGVGVCCPCFAIRRVRRWIVAGRASPPDPPVDPPPIWGSVVRRVASRRRSSCRSHHRRARRGQCRPSPLPPPPSGCRCGSRRRTAGRRRDRRSVRRSRDPAG